MLRIAALFLCFALCSAQELATKADAYTKAWFDRGSFMGSVLIARDGKPLFVKSYGWANAEWGVPNTPGTKFRLGSITKQFTSVAILQLVEQGKLKLDDPLNNYFTGAPAAWAPVTIHHLLTHTSGIPSYTGLPGFIEKRSTLPLTPAEIANLSRHLPLEFAPGEKYAYNNTGYVLLGYIIEQVTGTNYADYMQKHVFGPAGMNDTGYDTPSQVLKHRASGYQGSAGALRNARYLDMTLQHAAGALYSTVEDLLRWDQALYSDKLISRSSLDRMFTPVKNNYGFGWVIDKLGSRKRYQHGGGINGFNTMIERFPEDRLLVVVLSNLEGRTPFRIADDLAKIAYGESLPGPEHKGQ